jgi:hypothetical protein
VFLLTCGHMFHTKCLSPCQQPLCPMCRTKMHPEEAVDIFYSSRLKPLMLRLYGLSIKSITYVLRILETSLDVASYGDSMIKALCHGVRCFSREISV